MDTIRKVYELKLHNVEWGVVNYRTVTILRVGHRLQDVFHLRALIVAEFLNKYSSL
jgi:hypothetical protein